MKQGMYYYNVYKDFHFFNVRHGQWLGICQSQVADATRAKQLAKNRRKAEIRT